MKKAVALMIVAVMMFASFGTAHAEAVPLPGTPVIGIAWRGDTDSEFFTNICKAVEAAAVDSELLIVLTTSSIFAKQIRRPSIT